jgi:serine/threonine protein kinase
MRGFNEISANQVSTMYCFNPFCQTPQNSDVEICVCGFGLRLSDRYRAIRPIGQGGFGRTFLAIDEAQPEKLPCVIKQFAPQSQENRVQAAALFEQEAARLAELGQHAQIPALLSHCEQAGYQYLVQEFIDGQNLAQELRDRGPLTQGEIENLLSSLLPVLQFIHDRGVIHRDIKPENIIRRTDDQWVLVDFGAAKQATGTALLKTGTTIGSAEFIAPEQARGKAAFASDLYSLGVTCLHLLTQVSPFDLIDGNNHWVWRDWLKANTVSEELGYLLDKMVAAPNQRFQSAAEVLAFLKNPQLPSPKISDSVEQNPKGRSLRRPLLITGLSTFVLGAIIAAIALPSRFIASPPVVNENPKRSDLTSPAPPEPIVPSKNYADLLDKVFPFSRGEAEEYIPTDKQFPDPHSFYSKIANEGEKQKGIASIFKAGIYSIKFSRGLTPAEFYSTHLAADLPRIFDGGVSEVGSYGGGDIYRLKTGSSTTYLNLVPMKGEVGTIVVIWLRDPRD